jgi:hypothetical protein
MRGHTAACALLFVVMTARCGVPPGPELSVRYPPASGAFSYFPVGTFSPARADLDTFRVRWYGGALLALREPPLRNAQPAPGTSVLRFLWLRSFHPEVAVRVELNQWGCRVITSVLQPRPEPSLSGGSGSVPITFAFGSLARKDSSALSARTCEDVSQRLDEAAFWSAPVTQETLGVDGAEWVFEGVRADGYHVIDRWSPSDTWEPRLRAAGLAFLRLGRATPGPRELY